MCKKKNDYISELYHYGVKGMKWGVRRYQPYGSGGYTPKKKRSGAKYVNTMKKYGKAQQQLEKIDAEHQKKLQEHADKNFPDEIFDKNGNFTKKAQRYFNKESEIQNKYTEMYEKTEDKMYSDYKKSREELLNNEKVRGKMNDALKTLKQMREQSSPENETKLQAKYEKQIDDLVKEVVGDFADVKLDGLDTTYGQTGRYMITGYLNQSKHML